MDIARAKVLLVDNDFAQRKLYKIIFLRLSIDADTMTAEKAYKADYYLTYDGENKITTDKLTSLERR